MLLLLLPSQGSGHIRRRIFQHIRQDVRVKIVRRADARMTEHRGDYLRVRLLPHEERCRRVSQRMRLTHRHARPLADALVDGPGGATFEWTPDLVGKDGAGFLPDAHARLEPLRLLARPVRPQHVYHMRVYRDLPSRRGRLGSCPHRLTPHFTRRPHWPAPLERPVHTHLAL